MGVIGKYPPSGKEVLLQFFVYHKIKQEESKGTSTKQESLILVVEDIEKWWKKTGIGLKNRDAIIYMVKKLTERYENLKKHKNRKGKERQNREKFLDDMQHTLWFVNKKTEKDLKTPTNSKKAEDWVYLEAIPGKNRKATFGSLNNKEQRKLKRNIKKQDQAMKRKLNLDTSFQRDFLRYISSEERAENMDQTFIPELTAKPKKKRKQRKS